MEKNLLDLLMTNTPSGNELSGIKVFNAQCEKYAKHVFQDALNNSCFKIGLENGIPFMISAHIDEISLQVQYIDNSGFIYFISNGAVDPKTIIGSSVTILNKNGNVIGVIGKKSTLIEGAEKNNVNSIDSMKIDCGFETKDEALRRVSIGDTIIINSNFIEFNNHRFSYKGLDDKLGVYIVSEVLRKLSDYKFKKLSVYGLAMAQEEVGGVGAIVASRKINPKYSIDYDVTFTTDDGHASPVEWGEIELGKGGAIAYSSDCSRAFTDKVIKVAEACGINHQIFSRRNYMCNTSQILENSSDCSTCFIAIPLRNMHTQVEVADIRDIKTIIKLTIETIIKIDNE